MGPVAYELNLYMSSVGNGGYRGGCAAFLNA
jgi:hypothetical protein